MGRDSLRCAQFMLVSSKYQKMRNFTFLKINPQPLTLIGTPNPNRVNLVFTSKANPKLNTIAYRLVCVVPIGQTMARLADRF